MKKQLLVGALFVTTAVIYGCGPLTPHVDVATSGGITVSGTETITVDPSGLLTFFTTECQTLLCANVPAAQLATCQTSSAVSTCAAQEVNSFLTFVGASVQPSPSPSPSP